MDEDFLDVNITNSVVKIGEEFTLTAVIHTPYSYSFEVELDITTQLEASAAAITVVDVEVASAGDNIACLTDDGKLGDPLVKDYNSSYNTSQKDSASIRMGIVTNHGKNNWCPILT